MPPEPATTAAAPDRHLRLVPRRPLRVVDVACFFGDGGTPLRAYLDAKSAFARGREDLEHRLLVPDGPQLPFGGRGLLGALEGLRPDVVLLHAPFWRMAEVCRQVRLDGGITVMVHADRPAQPEPPATRYQRALQAWLRHTYDYADASVSLPLGIDAEFGAQRHVARGDQVLGPVHVAALEEDTSAARARAFARAGCVIASHARTAAEAIACGTPVATASGSPACTAFGARVHTFRPGSPTALARAVDRARRDRPDAAAAARFAAEHAWERVLERELHELEALAR